MTDYDQNTNSYQRWSNRDSVYSLLEWYVFLERLGAVDGLHVLDMACGEGRLSRVLMTQGAASVLGTDISSEMIDRARQQNDPRNSNMTFAALEYKVMDASDEKYQMSSPADLVTAMYLFHYADSELSLLNMCRFISRNLQPGGRFLTYTINPDYNFDEQFPNMEDIFGFRYEIVDSPKYNLVIGDFKARIWQWSKADHEASLKEAGLVNIQWHPLQLPPGHLDLSDSVDWYIKNPSCIVLSAEKPVV